MLFLATNDAFSELGDRYLHMMVKRGLVEEMGGLVFAISTLSHHILGGLVKYSEATLKAQEGGDKSN